MKKPRKKYRPKPVLPGGGLVALAKLHHRAEDRIPLHNEQQRDLSYHHWAALENLRSGPGDYESWECIVSALNIGMALCEGGIGPECINEMIEAQEAAIRAKVRANRHGAHRLDGDGMRIITEALRTHDAQLEVAQRQEVVTAIRLIKQRLDEGQVFTIEAA